MIVSELIEKLQQFPLGARVIIDNDCGCLPNNVLSVFIPNASGHPYGKHTGVDNDRYVVIAAEEIK